MVVTQINFKKEERELRSFMMQPKYIACGLLFAISCIRPTDFKDSTPKEPQNQSDFSVTQDRDRPSEGGVGFPGYLVACTPIPVEEPMIQVGCGLKDDSGNFQKQSGEGWMKFEAQLPADAPASVTVRRRKADPSQDFDTLFEYQGAEQAILFKLADRTAYAYVYTDAGGATQRLESLANPLSQGTLPPCQNPRPGADELGTSDSLTGIENGVPCKYP